MRKRILFICFFAISFLVKAQTDKVITIEITEPEALTLTLINKNNPSAFAGVDGSITIQIDGGTAASDDSYTVEWRNSSNTLLTTTEAEVYGSGYRTTLDTIGDGAYTVTVFDNAYGSSNSSNNAGCSIQNSYTLTQPDELTVSISQEAINQIRCNGGTSILTANPDGGISPYKYKWYKILNGNSTLLTPTTQTISNLSAGLYKVEVIDNDGNGITKESSKLITEPTQLAFSSSKTNALCKGEASGAIDITVSGGTPPYDYLWSNGATAQDISGLNSGVYSLNIKDGNGCILNTSGITITEPQNALSITTDNSQNVSSNSGNDGAIAITVSGGTQPYSYQWVKDGVNGTFSTNQDLSNLSKGVYTVTIRDNNGCEIVKIYTITEPLPLTVELEITNEISCFNASNGKVTATGSGGAQILNVGYTYQWFKETGGVFTSTVGNSNSITSLEKGNYKVVITDDNGNQAEDTITLLEPSQLSFSSLTRQDVLCKGEASGSIIVSVSGGTPNYTFSWTDSSGSEISTNQNISNLIAGTYHLEVRDSRNCVITQGVTITEPSNTLQLTLDSKTNPTVFQSTDGSINITIIGGSSPYTYEWKDSLNNIVGTTEDISGIGGGTYTVTVKDANFNSTTGNSGCTVNETITLVEPALLKIDKIDETNSISCFGDSNGALKANVSGGIAPYTYEWFIIEEDGTSTSLNLTDQQISNLPEGKYQVKVTDANLISITGNKDLIAPEVLSVAPINITHVLCNGDSTGAIDITVNGGTAPYTYFWNYGGVMTQDISGLPSGTYSVTITDDNGCEIVQNDIIVNQPLAPLSIDNSTVTPLSGFETNDGKIEVSVLGGTAPYTYSWVKVGTTTELSTSSEVTGLAIGNYQVTITDNNLCKLTQVFEVTQPDKLVVEIEQTLLNLCFNDSLATIKANTTGGVLDYSYLWYNMNDTSVSIGTNKELANIMAGTYGVTITDANGNEASDTITINQPDQLTVNNTITHVLCFGEQTGAIDITVNGGTIANAYKYIWSNGATTEDISGLSSGTYSVTITDDNNCSVTETYIITQPNAQLQISNTIITAPLGFGLSNGSISITMQEGTPGYSYTWFNSSNTELTETTNTLNNIEVGNYSVRVTDANNCILEQQFTVEQPPLLEVSITNDPINCKGETGTLIAEAYGGLLLNNESYNYQWYDSNFTPLSDSATLSDAFAGNYYVIVTDSNGITVQDEFDLTEPDELEITNTIETNVLCYGEQTGAIDITVNGGTGTYTYSWSNAATTQDINELSSGEYTVTIIDENNCTISETYTITQPVLYDISSVSLMRPTGNNLDGSISIEVTGGEAPFTYQWYNSSGVLVNETTNSTSNTNVLNNLEPETYTIIITDNIGCVHEETYNLANPGELITDIEQTQEISCFGGSDGQLMANSIGGSGGNQYTWYNADTNMIVGTDSDFLSNIPVGSYYVIVSNADGIQEQSSILTITQPDIVQVTSTSQNVSCYQEDNGTILLQATGGTNVFEYRMRLNSNSYSNWLSFTENSILIENLISGNYELQVRDSNQCNFEINGNIQTIAITITQPNLLEIETNTVNDATGFGLSNGSVEVSIIGGTLPYAISWRDANGVQQSSTTDILSNIPAGTYTVDITDAQGCTIADTYTITEPDLLEVTVDTQNIILCNGDQDGSIIASVTGGVPFTSGSSYLYNWFEQGNTTPLGTNVILEDLVAGTYFVIVEDQNGNTAQSNAFELTQPEVLIATLDGNYINCGTDNDWTISTQVSGGTPPYSYSWNTGDNTSEIVNVKPGNYLVIITDAFGCEIIETYNVDVPEVLNVDANITQVNCADACEGVIDLNITGGVAPYTINWETGDTTNSISNICPGDYRVSVVDQQECEVILNLTIENPEVITLDLGEDRTLCNGQSHDLDISIDDPNATYLWTSNNGFTSSSPSISLTEAGIYTATVTTVLGCTGTDSIEIVQSNVGINSQFLITTQAFAEEDILLINTSNPISTNVQWILPNEAQIIEENNETITLRFDIPGAYEITLRSFQGNCFQDYTKPVIVEEARDLPDIGDADTPFIIDFVTYPNPTTGEFEVNITLLEEASISLRLFSLVSNVPLDDRYAHSASEYNLKYNVSLSTGIYFLLLETAKGNEIRKIIIE
ncbi:T9SS type A sorting domain-containing protein [uncultured Polaribacter sp.]|uniref:T9SS type A sorting domain-containing protein n=1 Tax=uncultured Polaribacter sp. TaxID=174711 RepID=UPI0026329E69|nr:T9SS type A sorting domain-containing protein [uncultured Polaribacter sp.]